MAAVAPPRPSYKLLLPSRLVGDGVLSDAQLESVVYAGEAHSGHLAGSYTVEETWDQLAAAPEGAEGAVRFRRGWFLGDGTGAGKGRQVAAIILDNWLKGRRRALISKSDKLIEDAERDWTAIGGYRSDLAPPSRFKQGAAIDLAEGILFTTYATLRTQAKGERRRRNDAGARLGIAGAAADRRSLGQSPRRPCFAPSWRRLYVARDNDAAGRRAAQHLHERGQAASIEIRDLVPVHEDFNADLCAIGPAALSAHLAAQLVPADLARFTAGQGGPA